ncbi:hypothetical protein [Rhizobium sp. T1473]|uniref:hypothetical protein n=1 Tax=Rhizobium sp. T1470 TaxID=555320 RepID=UPI001AAE57BE
MCGIVEIPIRRLKTTAQYQSPGDPRNNAKKIDANLMLDKVMLQDVIKRSESS